MKTHFIQDLLQMPQGQTFQSVFRLKRPKMLPTKTGGQFLLLLLADKTGEVEAKWWEGQPAHCDQAQQTPYALVRGKTDVYEGKRQVIIHSVSEWQDCPEDASLYETLAPLPLSELQTRLDAHRRSVCHPHLKSLLDSVFDDTDFRACFDCWPAAKRMHHVCRHGLLQHTLEVTDLAAALCMAQSAWGYPRLSQELVVTGALLHDVGKVHEITVSDSEDYDTSMRGHMLGHLSIGMLWLQAKISKIKGFAPELRDAMLHIIAAHHGKPEFGSSTPPMFAEAQIIHMADLLDTQMFYFQEAAQGATDAAVKVWGLDNRWVLTRSWHEFLAVAPAMPAFPSLPQPAAKLPVLRFRTSPEPVTFRTVRLPLIGRAAAGMPQFAEQHIEDYVDVEEEGLRPGEHYLLQVDGESMTGDGIQNGDRVIVHRQTHHAPDDISVVFFDDRSEAAIKRVSQQNDHTVALLSSNPAFAPICVTDPSSLRLCGKVVGILRN